MSTDQNLPSPDRELRAAWVATVDNIDWPSRPDLSVAEQQQEAIAILDRVLALKMNAVIFQVRPQADALYHSELEPWSCYLTGEQGMAPSPGYDPLAFWIAEAHKRGIQLHAWFNPFRANHKANRGPISDQSIIKQKPELVVKLGDEGYWWMDPSQEDAKHHTINVILDVVKRYDIDGVHFDDYFYPYPSYNNHKGFPDDTGYTEYRQGGGTLSVGDWRRDSVNQLIQELGPLIKHTKPGVYFGISPFGIWRPNNPPGVAGMDQFEELYADARLWIREGWVDYLMPQLYWPIGSEKQSFSDLLLWWNGQNFKKRHIWPGLNISGVSETAQTGELLNQISFVRDNPSVSRGVCLFSAKHLMDPGKPAAKALSEGPWKAPAVIPPTPWLNSPPPPPPSVDLIKKRNGDVLTRFRAGEGDVLQFVINEKQDGRFQPPKIVPAMFRSFAVGKSVTAVAVRSVDRTGNISSAVVVELP